MFPKNTFARSSSSKCAQLKQPVVMSLKASASEDKESLGLFPLSYTINVGTGTAPTDHKSASKW